MALTLTFNQPGIPAGDLDRGRTDILTTDAGGGRSPVVTIDIGDVPAGSVVLVQAIDEPPASSPMLTQVSDTHWTLEFNAGAWGPFRIQATASIGTEVVSSVTRRISVRSPTFHLAYPALSERYDPNAHLVPTVPSVQLTEMNEHSTNRALVDFHREVVQAIDTLSAGGIDSIPDGSITEAKLDPALVAQLVLTDGSHAMVGELDMSGSRIVDLGQPTLPTDAARLADADYTAGAGLLRTDHTLDVVAHVDGSIVVGTDSVQVGVLASDAQHGTRGGGTLHATVTPSSAGFASAADKTKLDGIAPGADVTIAALAAAAVPVSVNGQRITNLGAPIAATDAVRTQDLTAAAVVAGAGLVRAGTTLDVVAHADGSIVVAADSVQVGVLATDAQHGTRGGAALHAIVTPTVAGFSSAADKTKLDGIAPGADVTIAALAAAAVPVSVNAKRITNLGTPTAATDAATKAYVDAAPPVPHASTHADGGSDELNVAGLSGLLADPQTAGSIKTATTTVAVAAAAAPAANQALMATSSTAAAWRVPPDATTSLPGYMSAADKLKLDGVASSAAAVGSAAASQVTVTTAGPGIATTTARSDHVHSVATAAPSALTVGGTQAPGTSSSLARADHVHAMPALVTTSVDGFMSAADKTRLDGMATAAAAVGSTAASQVTVATAASGAATTAARSDHVHSVATAAPSALTVGAAQNAGTSTSLVRADHVHAMPAAGTPVALTLAGANAPGSAATLALSDHVHALPATAAPAALTVGAASSAGVAVTLPRSDHVHAMPALVTTSVDGFMSAADKARLDNLRWKQPVRAATTGTSITLAGGAPNVLDGVTLAVNDRLLIKNNLSWQENGIYSVTTLGTGSNGTWTRATDADTNAELTSGTTVFVSEGTAHGGSVWTLYSADPISIGSTIIGWALIGGKSFIAGLAANSGLVQTPQTSGSAIAGTTLAVGANADGSIVVNSNNVQVGVLATDAQHGARAGGTTHAAVIAAGASGFMTGSDKTKLDDVEAGAQVTSFARVQTALAAATSAVSFNAQRLSSVLDPSAAQDAATKAYVDAIAQGLDIKASVRLVATSNVAALTGNVSIDGSTTAPGQRVLLVGQTTASANGLYLTAAGAWARTTDADTSAKVTSGMYTFVSEGTANADSGWALITLDPIVLGTTALTFTQVTGAGQITAGAGMTKSGNTLDVVAHADGSIIVAADSVQLGVIATDAQHGARAGGTTHAAAIAGGASGFLTGADKTKLDGISTSAAALTSTAPLENTGAAAVGVATTAARGDHQHPSAWKAICVAVHESVGFDAAAPPATVDGITIVAGDLILVDGTLAPLGDPEDPAPLAGELLGIFRSLGSTWQFLEVLERGDVAYVLSTDSLWTYDGGQYVEVYPDANYSNRGLLSSADYTKLAAIQANAAAVTSTAPTQITVTTAAAGSSSSAARGDHVHSVATAAPSALTVGGAQAAGSSTSLARTNHMHTIPTIATGSVDGFMAALDKFQFDIMRTGTPWAIAPSPSAPTAGSISVVAAAGVAINFPTSPANGDKVSVLCIPGTAFTYSVAGGTKLIRDVGGRAAAIGLTFNSTDGCITWMYATNAGAWEVFSVYEPYAGGLAADPQTNDYRLAPNVDDTFAGDGNYGVVYLAPVKGDRIALYDTTTSSWRLFTASSLLYSLSGRSSGIPFDLFAYQTGGVVALEAQNWSTPTGRSASIGRRNGVWVKNSDNTRRYLGTVRPRSSTTYGIRRNIAYDTGPAGVDIWNVDNRQQTAVTLQGLGSPTSYAYTATSYRQANASANAQIDVITGITGDPVAVDLVASCNTSSTTSVSPSVGIGFNSTSSPSSSRGALQICRPTAEAKPDTALLTAKLTNTPQVGVNAYTWLECGGAGVTFFGTSLDFRQFPAMTALVWY